MDPLRIGVVGLEHDHVWGALDEAASSQEVKIVGVAEPHEALRQQFSAKFDAPTFARYDQILDAGLDAVLIFTDNASHPYLIDMAGERGLAVMVEKPLAASIQEADRIVAMVHKHKMRLMVNWPFAWWPQMQQAWKMATDGTLGRVWQVKYRAAHAGPQKLGCSEFFCDWLFDAERNGAGALIDYCCYGALLARLVLGVPSRVTGIAGRLCNEELSVEDNAVLVMTYPRGMAMSEASWSQIGNLSSYITWIYGTEGTLMVQPRTSGQLLWATEEHPDGVEVEVPGQEVSQQSPLAHFAHCLRTGEDFSPFCSLTAGRDAQEILSAGLISAELGEEVSLPLRHFLEK